LTASDNDRMPAGGRRRPTGRIGRRPGNPATRERILLEARRAFAESGYTGASLRHIAARAEVDPALIHHYFGTKEQLFLATVQIPINPAEVIARIADGPIDSIGARLVGTMMGVWESESGPAMVATVRRVLADPSDTRSLQEFVAGQIIRRVIAAVRPRPEESSIRAALVTAHILGLVVGRYVLAMAPLATIPREQLIASVGATVQRYLTGPLPEAAA